MLQLISPYRALAYGLVTFVTLHVCISRQQMYAHHQWSHQPHYLPQESYDHSREVNLRQMVASLWPNEFTERITVADPEGSESHISSKIEHYDPMFIHTSKPSSRSILTDPSVLTSTIPPLLLTVLTFPLTLTLLFHIVRQLVIIQNTFNQSIANLAGANQRTDEIKQAESKLEKAMDKFQPSNKRTKRHLI